jgi:hypothetical protein
MRCTAILLLLLTPFVYAEEKKFSGMSYLDNGEIRVGVNLDIGGAITWVSKSGTDENIVNSHDWGRQIQMSFYSGPKPFEPNGQKPSEYWKFLGWNPIQSGDTYGNPSRVTAHENDGKRIYVECIPMHWPLDNYPAEAKFRVMIKLNGNHANVISTLHNARSDKMNYGPRSQELPAVYTNGEYWRLFTYDGDEPFSGKPMRQITKVWDTSKTPQEMEGGPWDSWYSTENWAALVNDDDFGLGIYTPGTYTYTGGFAGKTGSGGPKDGPTGYISPLRREILDHDLIYRYEYTLIVDDLKGIRDSVYDLAASAPPIGYTFDDSTISKRKSWTLRDCDDEFRNGVWTIYPNGTNPRLLSPDLFWNATDKDTVCIRAAFNTGTTEATIHWTGHNGSPSGKVTFPIIDDQRIRDYTINLKDQRNYEGICKGLTFEFQSDSGSERSVVVQSITLE